jgi:hypothetical protein
MAIGDEFLSAHDIAARLGVGTRQAYAIMRAGIVPSVRIGQRRVMVPRRAWEAWVSRQSELALARCGAGVERAAG